MIHSLWILRDSIAVFHLSQGTCGCPDFDEDLLAGFFSAISSFAESTTRREINSMSIGDLKFVFEKCNTLYFVVEADQGDNDFLLHKRLTRVQAHFLQRFEGILAKWDGNAAPFESFRTKAQQILARSIEGTVMYCEHCETAIPSKYLTASLLEHTFHFCGSNCKSQFEEMVIKYLPFHQCRFTEG